MALFGWLGWLAYGSALGVVWMIVKVVVIPFLGFNFVIGSVVHVHHVQPDIRWYPRREWTKFRGQMEGTTILRAPRVLDLFFHSIFVHIPHHVDMRIPFYGLEPAAAAIKAEFPDTIHDEKLRFRDFMRNSRQCKLYDFERGRWFTYDQAMTWLAAARPERRVPRDASPRARWSASGHAWVGHGCSVRGCGAGVARLATRSRTITVQLDAPSTTPKRTAYARAAPAPPAVTLGLLAALVVAALVVPGCSFVRAMEAPGQPDRLGEGGRVAARQRVQRRGQRVENWWYTSHPPPKGGRAVAAHHRRRPARPARPPVAGEVPGGRPRWPTRRRRPNVVSPVPNPLPNEGVWMPVGPRVDGFPIMEETQVRPDAVHTSLLDGLVWMDPQAGALRAASRACPSRAAHWGVPADIPIADRLEPGGRLQQRLPDA